MGTPVVLSLWLLRDQRLPVQNSNDGAFHVAVIRHVQQLLGDGRVPFDGWFSGLTTGFPVLHHYQTLPHVISGVLANAFGPELIYSWSLYLLLALWPVAVYAGGRLMGCGRNESGVAAFLSPLIVGLALTWIDGRPAGTYGYEWRSYTWGGEAGVWTQLWGMWLLPFALGLTWRTIAQRRRAVAATVTTSLTLACHFITGYLALASIGAWVIVKPSEFARRLRRASLVLVGSLLMCLWVIVPILQDNRWSNKTTHLSGWYRDGYGVGRVLGWLFTGRLFDEGRFPFLTILVLIGLIVCIRRSRRDERSRALLAIFALSLALTMGRNLLGPFLILIPGGDEILLSRLMIGVHLAGLYLAGVGAMSFAAAFQIFHSRLGGRLHSVEYHGSGRSVVVPTRVIGVVVLALIAVPSLSLAWAGRARMAVNESLHIHGQEVFDGSDGEDFARLVAVAEGRGPGRIYAGTCARAVPFVHCSDRAWAWNYKNFSVPGYIGILNAGGEAIGYPLRTASILTDVEARFDERNHAHYRLFNIRYIIFPSDRTVPIRADFVRSAGRHRLWEIENSGYIDIVDVRGSIRTGREAIGRAMANFLRSNELMSGVHPALSLDGERAHEPTLPENANPSRHAGSVRNERPHPEEGSFSADIKAERSAAVVLKASYHGRWRAAVDNRRQKTFVVAPGYVAVTVPRGEHSVSFRYEPYPHYEWLFAAAFLAFIAFFIAALHMRIDIYRGRLRSRR